MPRPSRVITTSDSRVLHIHEVSYDRASRGCGCARSRGQMRRCVETVAGILQKPRRVARASAWRWPSSSPRSTRLVRLKPLHPAPRDEFRRPELMDAGPSSGWRSSAHPPERCPAVRGASRPRRPAAARRQGGSNGVNDGQLPSSRTLGLDARRGPRDFQPSSFSTWARQPDNGRSRAHTGPATSTARLPTSSRSFLAAVTATPRGARGITPSSCRFRKKAERRAAVGRRLRPTASPFRLWTTTRRRLDELRGLGPPPRSPLRSAGAAGRPRTCLGRPVCLSRTTTSPPGPIRAVARGGGHTQRCAGAPGRARCLVIGTK